VRRSKRLNKPPPKAGRTSRSARKKQKDAFCKESKECVRSVKSSSEEWHSEEEKTHSATDIENDDERGNGDDEVSPVGVGKPHRGKQNPQVSVLTHYWDFLTC
jgi:hypothetical protein